MIFYYTAKFKKAYKKLPPEVQHLAKEKVKLFANDITHPSLRIKKIQGTDDLWEGSISMSYRFTFEKTAEGCLFRNIGEHDQTLRNP